MVGDVVSDLFGLDHLPGFVQGTSTLQYPVGDTVSGPLVDQIPLDLVFKGVASYLFISGEKTL